MCTEVTQEWNGMMAGRARDGCASARRAIFVPTRPHGRRGDSQAVLEIRAAEAHDMHMHRVADHTPRPSPSLRQPRGEDQPDTWHAWSRLDREDAARLLL